MKAFSPGKARGPVTAIVFASAIVGGGWLLLGGSLLRAVGDAWGLGPTVQQGLWVAIGTVLFALAPALACRAAQCRPHRPATITDLQWEGPERRASESLFSTVVNNLPVSLTVKDRDRRFQVVNQVFLDWVGLPAEAVIGRTNAEVFPGEDWVATADATEVRALDEGIPTQRTQERVLADGRLHTLLIEKFPISDETGEVVHVGTSLTDITELEQAKRAAIEREDFLKAFLENSPDAINVKDAERRYILVNRQYAEMFRVERDVLIGKTPQESGHIDSAWSDQNPETFADARDEDEAILRDGRAITRERNYLLADGLEHTFLVSKFPIKNDRGEPVAVASILTDITVRKRVEYALMESEARLRAVFDHLPMNLNLKDRDGRFLMVNAPGAAWIGMKVDDMIGRTIRDIANPEMAQKIEDADRIVLEEGRVISEERSSLRHGKEGTYVNIIKFPVRREDGVITGIGTAVLDITERMKAEEALRENEARLRAMFDHLPMSLTLKDREGRYLMVNAQSIAWLDRPADELIGQTAADLYDDERADLLMAEDRTVLESGGVVSSERLSLRHGDQGRFVHSIKFPVRRTDGEITGIGTALQDITERKRTEEALSKSESRFRAVLDNIPAGISMRDADGRYLLVNRLFENLFEISQDDIIGKRPEEIGELYTPDVLEDLAAHEQSVWDTGKVSTRVREHRLKDGSVRFMQVSKFPFLGDDGRVVAIGTVFVDVTDSRHQEEQRVRLEKQLQQAQKLEAVGRLAGGIAHDFNNLLGAIMGFAEFLEQDLVVDTPQHNFARRISQAGLRAKQLVGQILAFSRTPSSGYEPFDLVETIEECRLLLRGTLPSSTAIKFNCDLPRAIIDGSGNQISQVVMNLSVNAYDALGDSPGTIAIDVAAVEAADEDLQRLPEQGAAGDPGIEIHEGKNGALTLIAGIREEGQDYVAITVTDSGQGMDRETMERIFEPFFTTKEQGKGTGLGLSVVHGIVMGHRGALVVRCRKGAGCAVRVLLPLLPESVRPASADAAAETVRGTGAVLVVDDEVDVADMLSIGLERQGYEVGVCSDGSEALDIFNEDPDAWDALVTDQSMPKLKGSLLVEAVKKVRPDLPCIICTGYSEGLDDETARARGADAFFHKPVSPQVLARKLRDLTGH